MLIFAGNIVLFAENKKDLETFLNVMERLLNVKLGIKIKKAKEVSSKALEMKIADIFL